MALLTTAKYRFRKHDQIGAAAAEQDEEFLQSCFVDSGDVAVLQDCGDRRRILLGRTGTGKTALLRHLSRREEHVVEIAPEQLALAYLSNNSMLPFLLEIGVDLDQFFRLLWRHVFAIELIKERYRITTETRKKSIVNRLFERFSDTRHKKRAVEYLTNWADHFWKETEYRVEEVTSKLERDVRTKVGTNAKLLDAAIEGKACLTEEQKSVIREQAQTVVNQSQIRDLFEVVDLLATDLLDDPQYRIYVVIDRLDENWIEERFRYRLIRALVETVGEFVKVKNSKIILALRRDLIDRVIRETRDAGFQEEKYRDLYLSISWTQDQLIDVLDRRIDCLVKRQYTKEPTAHSDLMPHSIYGQPIREYMYERTLARPRDIILFFNHCIERSIAEHGGKPRFTIAIITAGERLHAQERLRSLADEWHSNFPDLMPFCQMLKNKPATFRISEIATEQIEAMCLEVAATPVSVEGGLTAKAREVIDGLVAPSAFIANLLSIFYRVGLVGLKTEAHESTTWSFLGRANVSAIEITENVRVSVCPMFSSALGVAATGKKRLPNALSRSRKSS